MLKQLCPYVFLFLSLLSACSRESIDCSPAISAIKNKEYDKAEKMLTAMFQLAHHNDDKVAILSNLAYLYGEKGEPTKAASYYEKILEFAPDDVETHDKLGSIYLGEYPEVKDFEKALQHYKRCVELEPTKPYYAFHSGKAYYRMEKYAAATPLFERAMVLNPTDNENKLYLGLSLYKSDRQDEGRKVLKELLIAEPDYPSDEAKKIVEEGK
ncbi:MAG: hypothetical protein A2W23_06205 [Planctomycetes bacterium RBG_16_43_13]|nr:MAG: hypothetical protein A2W23_06205 [Planctomycetes bacterium RBG_16_43_13]